MWENHREVFFAHNGPGPYECFHCHKSVLFEEVCVHHDDGNHENNEKENLKAAHRDCHTVYTHKGRVFTEEQCDYASWAVTRSWSESSVRAARVMAQRRPEVRAKKSVSMRAIHAKRREKQDVVR